MCMKNRNELSMPLIEEEKIRKPILHDPDGGKDLIGNDPSASLDVSPSSRRRTIESGIQQPQRWKFKLQRALTPV